jgi:AcrR family transcriptional regulator
MSSRIESQSKSSEITRAKLIDAGLKLFAEFGMDGVRTRTLAEAAGVNQAAIPYHFGGKEGVYAAVIEETAREIADGLASTGLLQISAAEIETMSRALCLENLRALIRAFTLLILSPGRSTDRTILIVREQLRPTENFDLLFRSFIEPIHKAVSSIVARLNNHRADDGTIIIRAHAIIGQVLAFAVAQQSYLLRSGSSEMSLENVEEIANVISEMAVISAGSSGN